MKKLALCLLIAFAAAAFAACDDNGSDEKDVVTDSQPGDPLQNAIDTYTTKLNGMYTGFCVCAADADSAFCQEEPDKCYEDSATCQAAIAESYTLSAEQMACAKGVAQRDPALGQAFFECLSQAADDYVTCVAAVSECGKEGLYACGDANEHADCTLPEAWKADWDACFAPSED